MTTEMTGLPTSVLRILRFLRGGGAMVGIAQALYRPRELPGLSRLRGRGGPG